MPREEFVQDLSDCREGYSRGAERGREMAAEGEEVVHDQLVAQFQAFTGLDDVEACRHILEAHAWNVEMAVQDTFNEQEGHAPVYGHLRQQAVETSGEASPGAVVDDFPDGDLMAARGLRHRAAMANTLPTANAGNRDEARQRFAAPSSSSRSVARPDAGRKSWWQWCVDWITSPVRGLGNTVWFLLRFIFSLFTGVGDSMLMGVPDAEGDVRRFVESFRSKYGSTTESMPNFLTCSYAQAIRQSKEQVKFLLVYCHADDNPHTETICRDILCSPEVAAFVNANMLVLGVSNRSPEGRRVSAALRSWGQPTLCTIIHRNSTAVCVDRMNLTGAMDSGEDVLTRLVQVYNAYEGIMAGQQLERQRREQDRLIRAEQELEYQEALRQDQQREQEKQREEEARLMEMREKEERQAMKQQQKEELQERRFLAAANLPLEPDASEADVVRLSFRLPNNDRISRSFRATDSLSVVRDFVFSHEQAPAEFSLQTSYPKRNLITEGDDVGTVGGANLGRAAMLIVKDEGVYESYSEDEESDDDEEEET